MSGKRYPEEFRTEAANRLLNATTLLQTSPAILISLYIASAPTGPEPCQFHS
jgi:hypothetical protein